MVNSLTLPPQAEQLIERVGGRRRAASLGVGIASVLAILTLARWATAPTWVPAFSGLPLEAVSQVTERLDEEGIPYKLQNGGAELLVTTDDLARARVALAANGLPSEGRPGLELFDQPAWGMTDFTQKVNYRRALEGELERTIGKMRGIETAKVHLALEETGSFRRANRPAEASVVLRLQSGDRATRDVVEGVQALVSSSIDGLERERVSVLDDTGRLLSSAYEEGSPAALASRELRMRGEIEQYLATKAEALVAQVVGQGNVRVQVSADINLDRIERSVELVDPEQQALISEQRAEIIPGAEGGAGSSNVSANYMNSRTVETFSGAVGNVKRLSVAVLVNDEVAEDGTVVAREPEDLARIQALVQSSVGIDPTRGDVITVASLPFNSPIALPDGPTPLELVQQYWRPALMLLGLLLAFVVAMRLAQALKAPQPALVAAGVGALPGGMDDADRPAALEDGDEVAGELEAPEEQFLVPPAQLSPVQTLKKQAIGQLQQQPDVAVRLIRNWLKEG